jgi:Immunoglobulin I-set domain.
MESRGSRHTLIIRKVQVSDFANYTCLADNQIGKTRQKLELSGKYSRCTVFIHCSCPLWVVIAGLSRNEVVL